MLSFLEKFEKEFDSSQKRIAQGLLILIPLLQLTPSFGFFGIYGHIFGILVCVFDNLIGYVWYLGWFENYKIIICFKYAIKNIELYFHFTITSQELRMLSSFTLNY